MTQEPIMIKGTNLPDVWHQALYKAIEKGRDFTISRGSNEGTKRKEMDFVTIHSRCPDKNELLPKLNPALGLDDPCAQNFLEGYVTYLMTDVDKEGESYTYGKRICKAFMSVEDMMALIVQDDILNPDFKTLQDLKIIEPVMVEKEHTGYIVNQMELIIWTYVHKGYRNNQMIMQVGQPTDVFLKDPPCLRHIDTRIQDGKLHFYPYFRSWDLWGGFPANLAAIEIMKQYMAGQIGVENGEIIASSKGLHLYNYVWKIAETVCGRTAEEFKQEMTGDEPNMGDLVSSLTNHDTGTTP